MTFTYTYKASYAHEQKALDPATACAMHNENGRWTWLQWPIEIHVYVMFVLKLCHLIIENWRSLTGNGPHTNVLFNDLSTL